MERPLALSTIGFSFSSIDLWAQILFYSVITTLIVLLITLSVMFSRQRKLHKETIERKNIIKEQEQMKTLLLNNLPGVVYRCLDDADWTMLFMSEKIKELTGYDPEDFYSGAVTYERLILPADCEAIRTAFYAGLVNKQVISFTYRLSDKTNRSHTVHETAQYIGMTHTDGKQIIEGFIEDISNVRKVEEKVEFYQQFLN